MTRRCPRSRAEEERVRYFFASKIEIGVCVLWHHSFLLLPRFVQEDARSVDEEERDDDDGKEADIATRSSRGGVGISIYVNI